MSRGGPHRLLRKLVLLLFPASFRSAHSEDIERFLLLQRKERRYQRFGGVLSYWRDVLADALAAGLRQRWKRIRRKWASRRRQAGSGRKGGEWMRGTWQDLRYALRTLGRNPIFAAVCVLTLGLGIGINSAIFSGVWGVIFKPLPVENADRLVSIFSKDDHVDFPHEFSYPELEEFRRQSETLEAVMARRMATVGASRPGEGAVYVAGELVTRDYFRVLSLEPARGRAFSGEDFRQANPVAIISHGLWQSLFAGDPAILGREIVLNGSRLEVVGVMPPEFAGSRFPIRFDVWLPVSLHDIANPMQAGFDWRNSHGHWMEVMGRMKPGVTLPEVRAEFDTIMSRLERKWPESNEGVRALVVRETGARLAADQADNVAFFAWLLMGLVGFVLLIACANVANLMLARAAGRRRELGVRLALGAGRFRLLRQMLAESLVLAALGGLAGLAMAYGFNGLMQRMLPATFDFPVTLRISPDLTVVSFTAAIALGAGLVFGLAPAYKASRTDPKPALEGGGGGSVTGGGGGFGFKSMLVSGQVALSLILLVGAGLFLRSFSQAQQIRTGLEAENLLMVTLDLNLLGYNEEQGRSFYSRLRDRLQALPEVAKASSAYLIPLGGSNRSRPIWAADRQLTREGDPLMLSCNMVGPDFFETVGTRILRGRGISEQDRRDSRPVVVVNEALADRFWPGEDPLSQQVYLSPPGAEGRRPAQVVGVAENGKYRFVGEDTMAYFFVPIQQSYEHKRTIYLRTRTDPGTLASAVRSTVRELEPNLPISGMRTLDEHRRYALFLPRVSAILLSAFAILALTLALVGVFGVISYSVSQRRREIGLRMALGAERGRVLRLILGQGMGMAGAGLLIGLAASFFLTQLFTALLYGIKPLDPLTFTVVPALLLACAAVASLIPAARASRIDPMQALRRE